jgi:hypothetical protein
MSRSGELRANWTREGGAEKMKRIIIHWTDRPGHHRNARQRTSIGARMTPDDKVA